MGSLLSGASFKEPTTVEDCDSTWETDSEPGVGDDGQSLEGRGGGAQEPAEEEENEEEEEEEARWWQQQLPAASARREESERRGEAAAAAAEELEGEGGGGGKGCGEGDAANAERVTSDPEPVPALVASALGRSHTPLAGSAAAGAPRWVGGGREPGGRLVGERLLSRPFANPGGSRTPPGAPGRQ